jgi:nucleotide-binding universal stress UspA family protein
MTGLLIVLVVVLTLALGAVAMRYRGYRAGQASAGPAASARRIVFPFVASALSRRALDAALRLARAESATLVPVFLARVPLHLPLDAALPRQSTIAISLQEAIEQRATAFGVPVDARIERGRTHRHALRQTIANERFERMVIAAAAQGSPGFAPDDVAWLLANAPGEIVVLRPSAKEEPLVQQVQRHNRRGHFISWGGYHPPGERARHRTLAHR